jgi:hypothetical protein
MNREEAARVLSGMRDTLKKVYLVAIDEERVSALESAVGYLLAEDNNVPVKQPDPITGLVPCGCGGKAAVKKGVNHRSGYYVICEKCECNIGFDRDDYLRPYGDYPTEERAVSDWDTAMGYTSPPRPGAIGPKKDGTAPNGDKGAES